MNNRMWFKCFVLFLAVLFIGGCAGAQYKLTSIDLSGLDERHKGKYDGAVLSMKGVGHTTKEAAIVEVAGLEIPIVVQKNGEDTFSKVANMTYGVANGTGAAAINGAYFKSGMGDIKPSNTMASSDSDGGSPSATVSDVKANSGSAATAGDGPASVGGVGNTTP